MLWNYLQYTKNLNIYHAIALEKVYIMNKIKFDKIFQIISLMGEVKFSCFYYICMSEAINFYGKLTARIATLALGFDPKGMKSSDIQYIHI